MKSILFLMLLLLSLSCSEPLDPSASFALEGKWVDQVTTTDTLEFLKFDDGSTLMNLHRGRALSNGVELPKIGAGPYTYSLSGRSIKLQYSLSSLYNPREYFFEQNQTQLKIGRFFDSENPSKIFTFRKIK